MTKKAGNSRVVRVHRDLVLCGIADETFGVRERYIGRRCPVTLVVGDNLDTVVLPDTDTTVCGYDQGTVREISEGWLTSRWCPSRYRWLFRWSSFENGLGWVEGELWGGSGIQSQYLSGRRVV